MWSSGWRQHTFLAATEELIGNRAGRAGCVQMIWGPAGKFQVVSLGTHQVGWGRGVLPSIHIWWLRWLGHFGSHERERERKKETCWYILPPFQNKKSCLDINYVTKWKLRLVKFLSSFAQMASNVAIHNVDVAVDELPSRIRVYTCLTIDVWTPQRRRTSTWFYALRWRPFQMIGFQWNRCQKILTFLWTLLARRKALSESHATHTVLC